MPEDNKGFSNPFLSEQPKDLKEQQTQGQQAHYLYPPMPQAQLDENGQPMPMYYPYPPMPQAQLDENGQPMPMYYPYPPMPQAQLDGNGQPMPMYYPYPPMPQAQLDENGQPMPMYYPYPPMPQAQLDENGQPMPMYYPYPPMPQAQMAPQVSQNPPSVSFEQPQNDTSTEQNVDTKTADEQPKDVEKSEDLELDGHKVYVRQPVIDTKDFLTNNKNTGEEIVQQDDMITREPRVDDSIFSAPTPVYSPEEGARPQDSAYAEKEEPKEESEDSGNFMESMQSLYSAFGETTTEVEKKESTNVVEEAVPDFTPTIDAVTKPAEEVKAVYSVPVQEVASPVEVDPSKPEKDIQKNIAQEDKAQETIVQEEKVQVTENGEEKDSQYWEFMNNLLSRFDDGEVHAEIGRNVPEQAEKPQSNFLTTPKEAEPDHKNLSNFGKNIDKKSTDKVTISRNKKSVKDDFEPESFEENFGEFGGKKAEKTEKAEKIKKPKKIKKEKAPKVKENTNKDDAKGFKKFVFATFPMKGDEPKEIVRKAVVIVSFLVLIGCATYFTGNFIDKKQNQKETSKLSQLMETGESAEQEWAKIESKYPNINFPSGMQTKFADLYAINPDLVGWVKIDGLDIDLPVVQTKDNDYYLKRNFNKEKSHYGTVFANFNNNIDTLDLNTVLFGHRMHKDTQMFTNLREYAKPEGFLKAPIIEFNTLYGNYKWKVYAVFITNGSSDGDNGYVFNYVFPNLLYVDRDQWEKTYGGYVNQINQRALYLTGVDIQPTDRILTLSTCTYEFDNARLVVVARMLREGESVEISPEKVAINSNPRYPQAWYDKKGISNPYKNAEQWRPVV